MATPQQRRQFEKQKRDLQRKAKELNQQEERIRQAQVALERDQRAIETEKREWKNKKAKMKNELSANRPQRSNPSSPRRGGGGPDPMIQRKMDKMKQELERLKREMGAKNEEIRNLRKTNKNLARDLRVLKKQLAGKSGKVQIVDHSQITKAEISRLKRDLKIARRKIHKLLDSIRVRKRYYGKHINKFKRGENKYVEGRSAKINRDRGGGRDRVVTKWMFADNVKKVKLSRGKRNRVTLSTDDGEVVLKPVQVVMVPEGGVGDVDNPEEIFRDFDDLDLDDEDMSLPPEDEDTDDEDDDEDAKVDDAEIEAELQEMLNDPEYANLDGEDDEDDPVYGADNFSFPADAMGGNDDGKDAEDPENAEEAKATEEDANADEEVKSPLLSPTTSNDESGSGGPYQVGDHVLLKNSAGIIRYIGPHAKSKGADVFGIELIDGTVGKHNGTAFGVTYFECPDKRGIFAKEGAIRRKMKPRDFEKLETLNADRALNEERRNSTTVPPGKAGKGKPNLMTFVIQESSKRKKDLDKLKDLLEEKDPEAQNQGFGNVLMEFENRHADFIANLDSLANAPQDEEEFDDVRTYNSTFMNFVALLGNTMAGKALLEHNAKHTIEYFLDELTARISDTHKLQDIHYNLDDNPDDLAKEDRCQNLLAEIVGRHQQEEDDLSQSVADNAMNVLGDFRDNNANWRGAFMRTKQNQDQLELLIAEFAARTKAIAMDLDVWKPLWQPPVLQEENGGDEEANADAGAVEDAGAEEPVADDDLDAPPENESGDEA